MSLLHKHTSIGYTIEIFEWGNKNWIKLIKELDIEMKSFNENRDIQLK